MAVSFPGKKLKQIEELLKHYPNKVAAIGDVCYLAQEHFGHLSSEVELLIAKTLELPPSYVHQVISFYTMYLNKPLGRHLIMLCDNVSCMLCGAGELLESVTKKLGIKPGETTEDRKFTLWTVECLGACELAPAVLIDEKLHGNLTPGKLDKLLEDLE